MNKRQNHTNIIKNQCCMDEISTQSLLFSIQLCNLNLVPVFPFEQKKNMFPLLLSLPFVNTRTPDR